MLRRLAELASRRVAFRRSLPERYGGRSIWVSPSASLRYWFSSLERVDLQLLSWADELVEPGSVVWDIGANVGLFAFAAAARAGFGGHVLALEPDPWLVALLRRTARQKWPGTAKVEVMVAAASERCGSSEFVLSSRSRSASHLLEVPGSTQSGGPRRIDAVRTVTLDSLLDSSRPPNLVKIDVETSEHLCLAGASHLLDVVRPIVLCEVDPRNVDTVASIFKRAAYVLYDASVPPQARAVAASPTWNTLAIPVDSFS